MPNIDTCFVIQNSLGKKENLNRVLEIEFAYFIDDE